MIAPEALEPLLERINDLIRSIDESPYLTLDERKVFDKELQELSEKVKEGKLAFPQLEKALSEINKNAALKEIDSLIMKIGQINPKSPRPEMLRKLIHQLKRDEITPDDSREEMLKLMKG